MQVFVQHRYRGQELSVLNQCHMFLQAIWVSDICDDTGKEVLKDAWDRGHPMESPFQWPPTVVACSKWQLWQSSLQPCLSLDQWWQLSQPLGKCFH